MSLILWWIQKNSIQIILFQVKSNYNVHIAVTENVQKKIAVEKYSYPPNKPF